MRGTPSSKQSRAQMLISANHTFGQPQTTGSAANKHIFLTSFMEASDMNSLNLHALNREERCLEVLKAF